MTAQFLTLRLTEDEVQIVSRLREQTGLSKSDIVKRALRKLASTFEASDEPVSLYALKMAQPPQAGNADRQSADIKQVVRQRLNAKRG